jgi:hypothetical protein
MTSAQGEAAELMQSAVGFADLALTQSRRPLFPALHSVCVGPREGSSRSRMTRPDHLLTVAALLGSLLLPSCVHTNRRRT